MSCCSSELNGRLSIDDAIEHCYSKAKELFRNDPKCRCGKDHLQLAEWLKELKVLRKENQDLKQDLGTFL